MRLRVGKLWGEFTGADGAQTTGVSRNKRWGCCKDREDGGTYERFKAPSYVAGDGVRGVGWKTGGWQLYFLSWGQGRKRPG